MKILDEIISTLDLNASVKDIRQGVFHTGVLTRHCGLAATLPKDALKQKGPQVKRPGFLTDQTPEELVQMAYSESILEAAIGMAGINSLLQVDLERCMELNAVDIILEKGRGKNIAVIGHFPFLAKVQEHAENLWVIEKNPGQDDFPETAADQWVPRADLVAITGTALTNHTLEDVLSFCDPMAYIIMLGDSVPLSPVLFDHRIDALSGTWVADPETALRCVSQGANFRQIKGVKRLTMFKN